MAEQEFYIDEHTGLSSARFSRTVDPMTRIETAHIDIDDTVAFIRDASDVLQRIALERANETKLAKVGRVTIDLALSEVGTLASTAVGAYVGSRVFEGAWPMVGTGTIGFVAHDLLRRPIVGARSVWHAWMSPYSPAAQSNERIRQSILDL